MRFSVALGGSDQELFKINGSCEGGIGELGTFLAGRRHVELATFCCACLTGERLLERARLAAMLQQFDRQIVHLDLADRRGAGGLGDLTMLRLKMPLDFRSCLRPRSTFATRSCARATSTRLCRISNSRSDWQWSHAGRPRVARRDYCAACAPGSSCYGCSSWPMVNQFGLSYW